MIAACKFIDAYIDNCLQYSSVKILFSIIEANTLISTLSSILLNSTLTQAEGGTNEIGDSLRWVSRLLQQLLAYPSISLNNESTNNNKSCPVQAIMTSLLVPSNHFCTLKDAQEARRELVETLVSISYFETFRTYFSLPVTRNDTGVQILLAIIRSSKTELICTREMALVALTNSTICTKGTNATIIQSIKNSDGLLILFELTRVPLSLNHLSLIYRTAKLLRRCLDRDWGKDSQFHDQHAHLMRTFTSIVIEASFSGQERGTIEIMNQIAGELIGIIATIDNPPLLDFSYFQNLLICIPEPRSQNGIVTASSVCLPPLIEHGTLQCYVAERDSFQANVIRAMIAYFDSFHSNKIWQSASTVLAIEKLVSFLANASNEHQTVITNASSLLARIVKGNDILMKKFRNLRGMEIMLDLGRSGKI